jgi:hypothetical protein
MTNPKFGTKSEDNKLENARISISLFLELFDLLGYWAQCQIIAYKRSAVDSEFTSSMIKETKDLRPIHMPLRRLATRSSKLWRIIFRIPTLIILSPRQVICPTRDDIRNYCDFLFEMLASQSAESHPWRFAFQKALRAMNRGQTEELLKPMPVRKTGAPFALGEWKLLFLQLDSNRR